MPGAASIALSDSDEVLALMADGRSNAAIGQRLFITGRAVSTHAAGIFAMLELVPSDDDNRRVLAGWPTLVHDGGAEEAYGC